MRAVGLVALVALAGCDVLFTITEVPDAAITSEGEPNDDASVDAPVDADLRPPICRDSTLVLCVPFTTLAANSTPDFGSQNNHVTLGAITQVSRPQSMGRTDLAIFIEGADDATVALDPPLGLGTDTTIGFWFADDPAATSGIGLVGIPGLFSFRLGPVIGPGTSAMRAVSFTLDTPQPRGTMVIERDLGAWHYVAVVITSSSAALSIDDNDPVVVTVLGSPGTSSQLFYFNGDGATSDYVGSIDDLRIWKRALPAAELKAIFQTQ